MYMREVFNKQNIETFTGVFSLSFAALKPAFLSADWWDYFIRRDLEYSLKIGCVSTAAVK